MAEVAYWRPLNKKCRNYNLAQTNKVLALLYSLHTIKLSIEMHFGAYSIQLKAKSTKFIWKRVKCKLAFQEILCSNKCFKTWSQNLMKLTKI